MCERGGKGDINWKSCFKRERLPTKEGRLMLFGSWYFVFPDWECLFNSQKNFTMWDCISRKHLSNCRKKLFLQMYKMDIKSVLYPLPNRNSAMSWELSVTCPSSPGVRAVMEARGAEAASAGSVLEPSQSRAWALLVPQPGKQGCCSFLCPARLTLALPVPAGVHPAYPMCRRDSSRGETLKLIIHCACGV